LIATSGTFAINPVLYKKINYDPDKDFAPIALYVKSPFVLVVNPALPIRSVPELIKLAKDSTTPLTYSTPGIGLMQHLSMEFMKQKFSREHDPCSVSQHAAVHHRHRGGSRRSRLRRGRRVGAVDQRRQAARACGFILIATGRAARHSAAGEAASVPDFEAVSWHVLLAPAATPAEIVDKLRQEMRRIMNSPEMTKRILELGLIPYDSPVGRRDPGLHQIRAGKMGFAGANFGS
jgi:hypothetical protein